MPRVVARIYDPALAETYRRLGLATLSGVALGVQHLAELLLLLPPGAGAGARRRRGGGGRRRRPPLLAGRPVGELGAPGEVQVVAIHRAGRTFLPRPGTTFEAGDRVHLAVLAGSLERLKALLGAG